MRVHREYSWRPQLLEARRVWAGAGPQRGERTGAAAYRGGLPHAACFAMCYPLFPCPKRDVFHAAMVPPRTIEE